MNSWKSLASFWQKSWRRSIGIGLKTEHCIQIRDIEDFVYVRSIQTGIKFTKLTKEILRALEFYEWV